MVAVVAAVDVAALSRAAGADGAPAKAVSPSRSADCAIELEGGGADDSVGYIEQRTSLG